MTIDNDSIRITEDVHNFSGATVKSIKIPTISFTTDAIDSMRYEIEELRKLIKEKKRKVII